MEDEDNLNLPINIHRKKSIVVNEIFAELFEEFTKEEEAEPASAAASSLPLTRKKK